MSAGRQSPRVFSIPSGAPFLPTLADAILSGRLAPLPSPDPLALAALTILLPTRRSVRVLRDILIERIGGDAVILPTIRPIGDVDEEDHLLSPVVETNADRLLLPQSISRLSRHLALTRLTLEWGRVTGRHRSTELRDEPLLIPASAADAARLASDLARLMDDLTISGVGFDRINRLVPDDQTGYFQITLDFLRIVAEHWPQILVAMGRVDPAVRRDQLVRAAADRIESSQPAAPIIAAGSTGSIPSTARLLTAIARSPNGAVVLPGLDRFLDNDGFSAIGGRAEAKDVAYGHPQYGLKQLIAEIGAGRDDVEELGRVATPVVARANLLSEAMRPAPTTDKWASVSSKTLSVGALGDALADVGLLVAGNEQEEALAIALAFRESVETPNASAALVTPDRDLARRVSVELGRWGLAVDDSAGVPLDRLPAGIFANLVANLALSEGDPVALLSVLKHPLAAFGLSRPVCRRAARTLEIALLRGNRVAGGIAALRPALAEARAEATNPEARHVAAARRRLAPSAWDEADALVAALEAALAPLVSVHSVGDETSIARFAAALHESLLAACADDSGSEPELWTGEAGRALARLFDELTSEGSDLTVSPAEAPALIATLMADAAVTPPIGGDRRIHIWGTLEARLQSVDLLVLAGLDEGVWPADTRTDPWLSRSMRAEIGLEPPERRIGLAAHDFTQGFCAPKVLVTRAEKRGGTPTVATRWLQRLSAFLGKDAMTGLRERGEEYLKIARALDRASAKDVTPAPRPQPKPPVASRPRSLSVTEIETLIRDPYAIYAKHILRLEPLDSLGIAPDYALRGTVIHDALGLFAQQWSGPYDVDAETRLLAIGREVLSPIADFPDIQAVWSHRFGAIARWFIAWERARDAVVARRFAEIDGGLDIATSAGSFRLRGRADRIDLREDGEIDILDFKTGAPPSARQVLTGLAPQLALEVAMARGGAFGDAFAGRSVSQLGWLALGQVTRGEPFKSAVESGMTADTLGEEALVRLSALIAAYGEDDRAYASRARPMFESRFESPYDHLARVREWALVESGGDPS